MQKFNALNFYKSSMQKLLHQKFNAKVQCIEVSSKSSMKSSMHWSFGDKSSMQKFNALKFCINKSSIVQSKSSMQKFNVLKFCPKSSMWKINVIAKCKEVLHQKRNEKVQFTEVLHQLFNEKVQFTVRTIEDSNANEHLKAHSGFSCTVFR